MDDQITYKKEYLTDYDILSEAKENIYELIKKSYQRALCEGIRANTIIINENMVKVSSFPFTFIDGIRTIPDMICGMNVYFTKDELPKNYSFAICEGPVNRLAEFESIGMEPDELRRAAELYRLVKTELGEK